MKVINHYRRTEGKFLLKENSVRHSPDGTNQVFICTHFSEIYESTDETKPKEEQWTSYQPDPNPKPEVLRRMNLRRTNAELDLYMKNRGLYRLKTEDSKTKRIYQGLKQNVTVKQRRTNIIDVHVTPHENSEDGGIYFNEGELGCYFSTNRVIKPIDTQRR